MCWEIAGWLNPSSAHAVRKPPAPAAAQLLEDVAVTVSELREFSGEFRVKVVLCAMPSALVEEGAGVGECDRAAEGELSCLCTESHSGRSLHVGRERPCGNVAEMFRLAHGRFALVGVVLVAFGCPFEGLSTRCAGTGRGTVRRTRPAPGDTRRHDRHGDAALCLVAVRPVRPCRGYGAGCRQFHDTRGTALANCVPALDAGCRHFPCLRPTTTPGALAGARRELPWVLRWS
jgi:hypothetical protein